MCSQQAAYDIESVASGRTLTQEQEVAERASRHVFPAQPEAQSVQQLAMVQLETGSTKQGEYAAQGKACVSHASQSTLLHATASQ